MKYSQMHPGREVQKPLAPVFSLSVTREDSSFFSSSTRATLRVAGRVLFDGSMLLPSPPVVLGVWSLESRSRCAQHAANAEPTPKTQTSWASRVSSFVQATPVTKAIDPRLLWRHRGAQSHAQVQLPNAGPLCMIQGAQDLFSRCGYAPEPVRCHCVGDWVFVHGGGQDYVYKKRLRLEPKTS